MWIIVIKDASLSAGGSTGTEGRVERKKRHDERENASQGLDSSSKDRRLRFPSLFFSLSSSYSFVLLILGAGVRVRGTEQCSVSERHACCMQPLNAVKELSERLERREKRPLASIFSPGSIPACARVPGSRLVCLSEGRIRRFWCRRTVNAESSDRQQQRISRRHEERLSLCVCVCVQVLVCGGIDDLSLLSSSGRMSPSRQPVTRSLV